MKRDAAGGPGPGGPAPNPNAVPWPTEYYVSEPETFTKQIPMPVFGLVFRNGLLQRQGVTFGVTASGFIAFYGGVLQAGDRITVANFDLGFGN
jgi:hypothetical protein